MTIAERFATALAGVDAPDLAGPELLPLRLARAGARALGVDGAGISLLDAGGRRVPLGASSEEAATAERLQFTAGTGPCATSQETLQPVFAVESDLRRRWPVFAELLLRSTPYRAVVALPLQPTLAGLGAMDLYFARSEQVLELDVFDALAVGALVTSALSDATVWSQWSAEQGPDWLHGPSPRGRAAVWEAMGKVAVDLEIDVPEALGLLRAHAQGCGRPVEALAAELLSGRLRAAELGPPADAAG